MNIAAYPSNCRSTFSPKSRWRASLPLLIFALVGLLFQGTSLAADPQAIFQTVQQQVAANPKQANAIVKSTLANLSPGKRKSLASGIFAAALQGLGSSAQAQALSLFTTVFDASPDSVGALLKVAYASFPTNLGAFMGAGITEALALGRSDLVPNIVTDAINLAPDQRAALTALADNLAPSQIGTGPASSGSLVGPGPLGGTVSPANASSTVVSNEKP